MKDILVMLTVIDWVANDVHYKSRGSEFYSLHLLADKVRDVKDAEDDIKEVYYLGVLDSLPPGDTEIAKAAVASYESLAGENNEPLRMLYAALLMLEHIIEQAKTDGCFTGGCHAILDDVSLKASKYKFLVKAQIGE